jgi:hypothetical protein
MMAKYGVYDDEELMVKMDAIRQKQRQRVQLYYDRLEHLFNAKRRKRFMAHFRPKIRKLCVIRTYVDMDELLVIATKVEKVLGEIKETPFEPLKDERDEETSTKESSIERQIHVLNETLMKFFKRFIGKEIIPFGDQGNSSVCRLCNMVGHGASTCSKLSDRPKCGKCERGHRT